MRPSRLGLGLSLDIDGQGRGPGRMVRPIHDHGDFGVVEFQALQIVAPEDARACVAVDAQTCKLEVQAVDVARQDGGAIAYTEVTYLPWLHVISNGDRLLAWERFRPTYRLRIRLSVSHGSRMVQLGSKSTYAPDPSCPPSQPR